MMEVKRTDWLLLNFAYESLPLMDDFTASDMVFNFPYSRWVHQIRTNWTVILIDPATNNIADKKLWTYHHWLSSVGTEADKYALINDMKLGCSLNYQPDVLHTESDKNLE